MHHQVEQVLNGPTYVTILSSQEIKNKNWQTFITINLEATKDPLMGLLMGKGLVTVLDPFNKNKFALEDQQSKAYCDHFKFKISRFIKT
jgi:hypothetical protein